MSAVDLSVVIPVYRSTQTLRALVGRLTDVLEARGSGFEIILVDDGSPDDSWSVLCSLRERDPGRLVAIQLMRNYGQHNATMCGFHHARGRLIVTMDDDLQHSPEAVPELVETLERSGLDLVYGTYDVKRDTAWRSAASALARAFYRVVFKTRVTPTSFRAARATLVRSTLSYDLNFTYVDGLLAWNTERIGEVVVAHHARAAGRSGYSSGKLLTLALNLFTNFSLLPLQAVSVAGILTAGCGFAIGVYYFYQYLRANIDVPGYASIIVAVLVLGGTQLVALGIMGEYLGRLHMNVNRKPQYRERLVLGGSSEEPSKLRGGS